MCLWHLPSHGKLHATTVLPRGQGADPRQTAPSGSLGTPHSADSPAHAFSRLSSRYSAHPRGCLSVSTSHSRLHLSSRLQTFTSRHPPDTWISPAISYHHSQLLAQALVTFSHWIVYYVLRCSSQKPESSRLPKAPPQSSDYLIPKILKIPQDLLELNSPFIPSASVLAHVPIILFMDQSNRFSSLFHTHQHEIPSPQTRRTSVMTWKSVPVTLPAPETRHKKCQGRLDGDLTPSEGYSPVSLPVLCMFQSRHSTCKSANIPLCPQDSSHLAFSTWMHPSP